MALAIEAMTGIGDFIRRRRVELDLTEGQVAVKSGLAVGTISAIELGQRNPKASTLARIAPALDVSADELMRIRGFLPSKESESELPSELEDILAGLARDPYIRPQTSRIIRVIVLDEYRRHREATGD